MLQKKEFTQSHLNQKQTNTFTHTCLYITILKCLFVNVQHVFIYAYSL